MQMEGRWSSLYHIPRSPAGEILTRGALIRRDEEGPGLNEGKLHPTMKLLPFQQGIKFTFSRKLATFI